LMHAVTDTGWPPVAVTLTDRTAVSLQRRRGVVPPAAAGWGSRST